MKLIGLTGGSGSGKTTAAKYFSDCGAAIVDADAIARMVVLPGSAVLKKIAAAFGDKYIYDDGTLNRAALGRLVFSDKCQLKRLNDIMIPAISREIKTTLDAFEKTNTLVVVLDAPLLFDYHLDEICDAVVLMQTPLSTRIERLVKRDGLSEAEVRQRIASQQDFDALVDRAEYFLDASDRDLLRCEVARIYNRFKEEAACE